MPRKPRTERTNDGLPRHLSLMGQSPETGDLLQGKRNVADALLGGMFPRPMGAPPPDEPDA